MVADSERQRIARLTPLADVLASFDIGVAAVEPREVAVAEALGKTIAAEIAAPFVVPYDSEWVFVEGQDGSANLAQWAGITGGQVITWDALDAPTEIIEGDAGRRVNPGLWLVLVFVVLWPVEIALRRRFLPWA